MEDIILIKEVNIIYDRYTGSITKEMDKFLKYKSIHSYKTYIAKYDIGKKENIYVFRVPGATRGDIITDKDNVIKEINFYKNAFDVYQENITNYCGRFIGCKLIFKEE